MKRYQPSKIEKKWQKVWLAKKVHKARESSKKPKYYQLETFPYPSAAGLHVGHPKGYIAEDIHARFMRMRGHQVLYTIGWDAFGLPTENYAIQVGKSPAAVAKANIKNFKRQVRQFGFSYDWDREINTSSPDYYKWTQWLFIQLFKKGLAYRAKAKVNWCPKDKTVLANEQVIDGRCQRDDALVEQRQMEQWFLKITDYTDRLLKDLKGLDWPAATIKRQQDWIGRSEGRMIKFSIFIRQPADQFSIKEIEVFTTRPDTIDGATYMVVAPEHPIVSQYQDAAVKKYLEKVKHKTDLERQESKEKTGVPLSGVKAINPHNKKEIPVWVADYVLVHYGTGAIMAVPAHDQRDREFAEKFKLPITDRPLLPKSQWPGRPMITYKIRDWSVSRQRYWGTPIPMIHCSKCGIVSVPEESLPVLLPPLKNYRPQGMPPLASSDKFIKVKCPECGGKAERDPETLDTFVDSSWYYLAYAMQGISNYRKAINYWLPVDLYIIGAEHTNLHLLYSRFITKFLYDQKQLNFSEPFLKLRHVGLILGEDGQKMSKSRGNVVNPDPLIKKFGADALRLYEMFMGPFADAHPWDEQGIVGTSRFLNRVWNLFSSTNNESPPVGGTNLRIRKFVKDSLFVDRALHRAIKKVTEDIGALKFNTAISALMIYVNKGGAINEEFLKLLFPFVPHFAQELWSQLGHKTLLDYEKWPQFDPRLIKEEEFDLVIQVNGKFRGTVKAPRGLSQKEAETLVKPLLKGLKPKKIIYVENRLINFVV